MERFGFIKQRKGEWVCVKTSNGPFCQYEHVEKALAEKDREIVELKEWKQIVLGTGTDQESVIRMAADECTKVVVQCWKDKCAQQEQELARLREALKEIADYDAGVDQYPGSCCSGCDSPGIAKAAIKEGA